MKNLDKHIKQAHHLTYLTSGQCLIFNKDDKQISELQTYFTEPFKIRSEEELILLHKIADNCEKITLGKFREWMEDIDKKEFLSLTNLNYFKNE
jgi:hypothetical protein